MIKEVILVPQDRCPLDVLAEMGKQTANSWIFFHENAVEKLQITADNIIDARDYLVIQWDGTEKYPPTDIILAGISTWRKIRYIDADNIAFKKAASDPEHIFFLKMEA